MGGEEEVRPVRMAGLVGGGVVRGGGVVGGVRGGIVEVEWQV